MIKLGITACFQYPDKNRQVFGPKTLSYIENDMVNYLSKKGILPILIPDVAGDVQLDILNEMDGFVLQGGSDIAPETYGEEPMGQWKGDPYRDQYELNILDFAIKNSKPVLGICRGLQLMNVYFGGTLYQDTKTQNPNTDHHRSAEQYDKLAHPIRIVEGKYLEKIYDNVKEPFVNSVHHQSVKDLGNDLDVYAVSPDGLIESFGCSKFPEGMVIGVQWHPEFSHTMKNELIDADILFDSFIQHCKK